MAVEDEIEELKHKVETLGQLTRSILSKVPEVRLECSVPRSLYGRALRKDNHVSSGWLLRLVEERQRRGEGAAEEGLGSEGLQAREASVRASCRAGGAGEEEEARKEGEVALQEGGQAWRKGDDYRSL